MSSEKIHTQFDELLQGIGLKDNILPLVQKVFDKVWKEEMKSIQGTQEDERKVTQRIEEKIDSLMELMLNTHSETMRSTYESKIEKLSDELKELKLKQSTVEKTDFDIPYRTALEKAVEMLKSPYKIWTQLTFDEKHKLFYFIFEEKLRYSHNEGY